MVLRVRLDDLVSTTAERAEVSAAHGPARQDRHTHSTRACREGCALARLLPPRQTPHPCRPATLPDVSRTARRPQTGGGQVDDMMLTTIRCSRVDGHGSVSPCVRAPPPPAAASLQGEPAAASQCSCLLVPTTARRLHAMTLVMILFADHPSRFRCIPVASPTLLSLSRPTTATSPRIRVLGVGWVLPCCSLSRDSRPLSITSICHRRWRVAFTSCASGVAGSRWRGRERERAKRGAHGMPRGGERQRGPCTIDVVRHRFQFGRGPANPYMYGIVSS